MIKYKDWILRLISTEALKNKVPFCKTALQRLLKQFVDFTKMNMNMLRIGNEKVSEANQSQKLIDGAKKNCQIVLDPNVPEFLPWKAAFYVKDKFVQQTYPVFKQGQKFPTYRAVLVDDLPEAENFGIVPADLDAFKELENKFVLEAKEVCQYCLVNTNNHFRGNNCLPRTDLSTTGSSGYGSDDYGSSGCGSSGYGSSGYGSSGYCSSGYLSNSRSEQFW